WTCAPPALPSCPTRRSSDLIDLGAPGPALAPEFLMTASAALTVTGDAFARLFSRFHWVSLVSAVALAALCWRWQRRSDPALAQVDRKSTRLNSSHVKISYAV